MYPQLKKFDPVFIHTNSLDECWFQLLATLAKTYRKQDINEGSFGGGETVRLEFDWAGGVIMNPVKYTEAGVRLPLAPTVPTGCTVPTTDADIERYFTDKLLNPIPAPNEHYSYGWFLNGLAQGPAWLQEAHYQYPDYAFVRETKPFNQVEWVINYLKRAPYSNHCTMQVGFPQNLLVYDWPYKTEDERGTTPCLRIVDLKVIKEGKSSFLIMYVYFRSWALYSGWPENMGGLSLLLEYIATMASTESLSLYPGAIIFMSKGLHCYSHEISMLEIRAGCKLENFIK
jgi:thymidylate synthase